MGGHHTASSPCRIVVFASGTGTNLQALLDTESSSWDVVGVVTDRPEAAALERAAGAGVANSVVDWEDYQDRDSFTKAIIEAADTFEPDFIVLAGFMRILGPEAVSRFEGRIINVHPSLLPAFPGAHAVRDALLHGVKLTGVTVHFVDEAVDHGPIIRQQAVEVLGGDDEATLHARIQLAEHRLLPAVVDELAAGRLSVTGRVVKRTVTA